MSSLMRCTFNEQIRMFYDSYFPFPKVNISNLFPSNLFLAILVFSVHTCIFVAFPNNYIWLQIYCVINTTVGKQ